MKNTTFNTVTGSDFARSIKLAENEQNPITIALLKQQVLQQRETMNQMASIIRQIANEFYSMPGCSVYYDSLTEIANNLNDKE